MDQDYYEGTDYLSPVPVDGDRTEEFEYEVSSGIAANGKMKMMRKDEPSESVDLEGKRKLHCDLLTST